MAHETIRSFVRRDEGQDLVEVALLLAMVGLMAAAVIMGLGQTVNTIFSIQADRLAAAANGATSVGDQSGGTTGGTTGGSTGGTTGGTTGGNGNGNVNGKVK